MKKNNTQQKTRTIVISFRGCRRARIADKSRSRKHERLQTYFGYTLKLPTFLNAK